MPDETNKPTPDPTVLTTEQLLREVERVKELMQAELRGLSAVFDEQFNSIKTQLALIERQRIEQKSDTATAVQAALSAAKEAVKEQTAASEKSITKTENATAEQMKQQSQTFTTAGEGYKQSIDDIKERVNKIENIKLGRGEAFGGSTTVIQTLITIAAVVVAVIALVTR